MAASTVVARVRKSAAPRAVIRLEGPPPLVRPPPFGALHQDHRDESDGDERLDDQQEQEHGEEELSSGSGTGARSQRAI
jgi:hypothetical protein